MGTGDASSATYPLAIAAISGGTVTVDNVGSQSLQGGVCGVFFVGEGGNKCMCVWCVYVCMYVCMLGCA